MSDASEISDRIETLYSAVVWLARLVIGLCVLVVVQIAAKAVIYTRVMSLLRRTNTLLEIVEKHGVISDDKANDLKKQTAAAARTVASVVVAQAASVKEVVPKKVADEIDRRAGSLDSGTLPTLPKEGGQ